MSRLFLSLFAVSILGVSGSAQEVTVDAERLERIRRMDPAERARLLDVVRKIKRLPEGERDRLRDNLRKFRELSREEQKNIRAKAHRLSPEERALFRGLVSHLSPSPGSRRKMRGFPRMLFFTWLQNDRKADFGRLKRLEAGDREEVLEALLVDFSGAVKTRIQRHIRKHRCVPPVMVMSIENPDGSLNWPKWQRFVRDCRGKRQTDMRRKPPRWQ